MAEKYCNKFGPGAHQLKIGKSFEKKGGNSVYHSIRYDFKPVSVDEERMGKLEVQENKSVSVTLPHIDGHGATNYKGSAKPANTKECILIIDHETGELTLERISNQIMLKKTRPEKAEKPNVYLDKLLESSSPNESKDAMNGIVLPSNPYQVKPEPTKSARKEPENPYEVKKEPENPYEVKKEPENPYAVKKEPENPYAVKKEPENPYSVRKEADNPYEPKKHPSKSRVSNSSGRPNTPQSLSRIKKNSPSAPYSSSNSLPGLFKESLEAEHSNHSTHTISPLHSNKSSPARPSPTAQQGYNIDSLGRVISESSDDSDSASSSGSDSDSDSEPAPDKDCVLAAAMAAAEAAAPPSFSLPGDLSDLLLPGTSPSLPPGPGHLPTARPQKLHKSDRHREKDSPSSKQKARPPPPVARPPPPVARPPPPVARPPPVQEEEVGAVSMPSFGSMPNFGDLGDDLQLSDSD